MNATHIAVLVLAALCAVAAAGAPESPPLLCWPMSWQDGLVSSLKPRVIGPWPVHTTQCIGGARKLTSVFSRASWAALWVSKGIRKQGRPPFALPLKMQWLGSHSCCDSRGGGRPAGKAGQHGMRCLKARILLHQQVLAPVW